MKSSLVKYVLNLTMSLSLSFLLTGCAFMQVKEESKFVQNATVLVGVVSSTHSCGNMPIVVAAYSENDSKRTIVHYTTLHELGPYELMVPKGIHTIIAFGDKNKNLCFDEGEPAGQILRAGQASAPAGGVTGNLDIVLSDNNSVTIDFPVGSQIPPKEYSRFHSTCPGAIANIDHVLFSEEYGKKGFWAPLEFFKEMGGNIYFLEAYDPNKIPILFVHGAGGSPQNWGTLMGRIDRDKYQPWIFYYPSGSSIDSMSYLLYWKLSNLQTKYQFKEITITAHSMGGLVVRSFLVNCYQHFPFVTNFISISTPWGGEALAEMGVKYAPAVIPAWRDMQPGSEFIDSLYRKKMPSAIDHYLFFGHKGNRNMLRANNDKVVTLASQLDQRSQRDAKMVYGFSEDHVSILSSEQVISQYNAILADIARKAKIADCVPGNSLRVDFSFDFPKDRPRPMSALLLRPVERKGAETWIQLSPDDAGRVHGPIPAGDYEVSMVAPAFVPEPVRTRVSIGAGAVPNVTFSMKPAGFLRGYVVKNEQRFQAGKWRQSDTDMQIQSIRLRGNGIDRSLIPMDQDVAWTGNYDPLIPLQEEETRYSDYYLSATDFASKGLFFFFDLPAGEYELTIHAKGYEPYSEMCDVRLGHYQNPMTIKLSEETTTREGGLFGPRFCKGS